MKAFYCFSVLIFALLVPRTGLYAQEETSDYIFTNDGVKILGAISRDFDFNRAKTVRFTDPNGKESVLGPEDIRGFGLSNGRVFETRKVPGEDDDRLGFFQLILRGKISLLSYNSRFFLDNSKDFMELASEYSRREVSGRVITSRSKSYLGVLSYMMAGSPCVVHLQKNIETVSYTESGFIKILMLYHDCEGTPFELLVEQIPVFRISMVGAVGASAFMNNAVEIGDGRKDVFDKSWEPVLQFGVKVDQIRRMPRFAVDISAAYSRWSTVVNSEIKTTNSILTGAEEFVRNTVSMPLFLDYIFLRSPANEYYFGAGTSIKINSIKRSFSITDYESIGSPSEVVIQQSELVSIPPAKAVPAVKIGGHFRFKEKIGFVTELQLEYLRGGYDVQLGMNKTTYNQAALSLMLGVRL